MPTGLVDRNARRRGAVLSCRLLVRIVLSMLGTWAGGLDVVPSPFRIDRASLAAPSPGAAPDSGTAESAPFVQLYLVLDTSASMMIGATPTDEAKIAAWVASNKGQVFAALEDSPCAFACHDRADGPLSDTDMQQGETVAHLASVEATTRFDMMKLALLNDPSHQEYCGDTEQIACNFSQPAGLLAHIRDTAATQRNFRYNLFGFNEGINGDEPAASVLSQDVPDLSQYAVVDHAALSAVAAGVNQLTIGLDTHLNPPVVGLNTRGQPHEAVLPALVKLVGSTRPGAGSSADNPLKFVIIVTDGLSSDRNWNYGGGDRSPTGSPPADMAHPPPLEPKEYCALWDGPAPTVHGAPAWQGTDDRTGTAGQCRNNNYSPGFLRGPSLPSNLFSGFNTLYYAQPLDPAYCATMKENSGQPGPGVTIAVVETPYVPLSGQDPPDGYPYETGVQRIIYPDGNPATHPGSVSALSAALKSCATSPAFYVQAADDTAIASGLIALFDSFVAAQRRPLAAGEVAPSTPPDPTLSCQSEGLDETMRLTHAAAHQSLILRFQNRSDRPCLIPGLAAPAFTVNRFVFPDGIVGWNPIVFCYLCSDTDRIPVRQPMPSMALAPGQSAFLTLDWDTEGRHCHQARSIASIVSGAPRLDLDVGGIPLTICSVVRYASYQRHPPPIAAGEIPPALTLAADDKAIFPEERPFLHARLNDAGKPLSAALSDCPEPAVLERMRGSAGETKFHLMAAPRRGDAETGYDWLRGAIDGEAAEDRWERNDSGKTRPVAGGFPGKLDYYADRGPGQGWQVDVAYVSACDQGLTTIAGSNAVTLETADWPWGAQSDGFAVALALHKDTYELGEDVPLRVACTQFTRDWTQRRFQRPPVCSVSIEIRDEAGAPLTPEAPELAELSRHFGARDVKQGAVISAGLLSLGSKHVLPKRPGTYQVAAILNTTDAGTSAPAARSLPVTLRIVERAGSSWWPF